MSKILSIYDREKKQIVPEKIIAKKALVFLYGKGFFSKIFAPIILFFIAKSPFASKLYGWMQKRSFSKRKIRPFIKKYQIETEDFEKKVEEFTSFNEFFIRKLKKEKRPIATDANCIVAPADARYLAFEDISKEEGFYIKGKKFSLKDFLQNDNLINLYENGAMIIARLSPVDYHRFHFPLDCIPSESAYINGSLYSVNPIALRIRPSILSENKRMITHLHSGVFQEVLFVEVGATYVGSICQTFFPNRSYQKGDEKGYFAFGGSTIVLLFKHNKIKISEDILKNSKEKIETRCLFGQPIAFLNKK